MRMRKRQNLAPRMEACRSVWLEDAAYLRGNWRSLMPQARELRLEIGKAVDRALHQLRKILMVFIEPPMENAIGAV